MLVSAASTSFPSNVNSQQHSFAPSTRLASFDSVHITPSQLHETPISSQDQSFQEDPNLSSMEDNSIPGIDGGCARENITLQLANSNQNNSTSSNIISSVDSVPTQATSLRQEVSGNDDGDHVQTGSRGSSIAETDICDHD